MLGLAVPGEHETVGASVRALEGQRYSPLTQIDTSNVKNLKVAWRFRVKTLGSEN